MAIDKQKYLQPSALCDFDISPAIRAKADFLISQCRIRRQKFERMYSFVKELPYGLEDWDLKASEILSKGWGMCSGKTNLLVALLRSVGIPARYRIFRIQADPVLWDRLGEGNSKTERLKELGEERDHVDCEVWLGKWINCDPGRDTDMEKGILKLGGSLKRQEITDKTGKVHYLRLTSIDEWAKERQSRRAFRSDREDVFTEVNKGLQKLREMGRQPT